MPYLNIIFHNTQHGGLSVNGVNSRWNYTNTFVGNMNVFQTNAGPGQTATASGGVAGAPQGAWGASITGGVHACGIFLCESPPYVDLNNPGNINPNYVNWQGVAPAVPAGIGSALPYIPNFLNSGFAPLGAGANNFAAFFLGENEVTGFGAIGAPVGGGGVPRVVASAHWFNENLNQALRCLGTGAAALLGPATAPWGNDRYGIMFQATRRTYPGGGSISGIFVHTKNTDADPGTQIAALCAAGPNHIIFGDLNLNLRHPLNFASLQRTVSGTHTILAIQQVGGGGNYYITRYGGAGACLDYALVPNAQVANVELWAHRPGAAATLTRNNSDHSVMMLRIHCL